jgi:hypothetical protein
LGAADFSESDGADGNRPAGVDDGGGQRGEAIFFAEWLEKNAQIGRRTRKGYAGCLGRAGGGERC